MYTDIKFKYDNYDLVLAMLKDMGHVNFSHGRYIDKNSNYLALLTEEDMNIVKDIINNSIYMKYLEIVSVTNMYLLRLNRLGTEERDKIENLLKLKGLLK